VSSWAHLRFICLSVFCSSVNCFVFLFAFVLCLVSNVTRVSGMSFLGFCNVYLKTSKLKQVESTFFFYDSMTWLIVTEHICPGICYTWCNHFQVLSSSMFYHWVCKYSNTTGATSGSGTAVLTEFLISTPFFSRDFWFHVWCFVDRCSSFYPFLLSFYSMSFFDLRILITLLISSNSFIYEVYFVCCRWFI
jgi:hypothetical protein